MKVHFLDKGDRCGGSGGGGVEQLHYLVNPSEHAQLAFQHSLDTFDHINFNLDTITFDERTILNRTSMSVLRTAFSAQLKKTSTITLSALFEGAFAKMLAKIAYKQTTFEYGIAKNLRISLIATNCDSNSISHRTVNVHPGASANAIKSVMAAQAGVSHIVLGPRETSRQCTDDPC
jgi:hypothetical protein